MLMQDQDTVWSAPCPFLSLKNILTALEGSLRIKYESPVSFLLFTSCDQLVFFFCSPLHAADIYPDRVLRWRYSRKENQPSSWPHSPYILEGKMVSEINGESELDVRVACTCECGLWFTAVL